MATKFENGLFIFRRDFRIIDNNGLNLLNEKCKNIYTIFIFTPEQVGSGNKYKSDNAVQFMIESLQDLASQISKSGGHLYTFYGHNDKVVADCIKAWDINIVCFNLDITPYARERDEKIIKLCEHMKTYVMYDYDYYLCEPGSVVNGSGNPYVKFTPYYDNAKKKKVEKPASKRKIHFKSSEAHISNKMSLDEAIKKFVGDENQDILVHGGRSEAIKILKTALKTQSHYSKTHNDLDKPTSHLSAYINFGALSIREIYYAFKKNTEFIRQLYWGSFYANVLYNYPQIIHKSLKPKYDNIKWNHNEGWFKKWCDGKTNFPIVDSCMQELNTTGYLHGRGRLIVASFLVKTMLINYKKGEKYFANKLTDYNITNNLNNWMWVTGNGASSQEYFKIFNVWTQSSEHDPDTTYIKKWLPQLKDVPSKAIHNWYKEWENYKDTGYGKPILDYDEEKQKVLTAYKNALK
jgi:deoxyribodipyrimidine photo-lyase